MCKNISVTWTLIIKTNTKKNWKLMQESITWIISLQLWNKSFEFGKKNSKSHEIFCVYQCQWQHLIVFISKKLYLIKYTEQVKTNK